MTDTISPYLQRPLRTLETAQAETGRDIFRPAAPSPESLPAADPRRHAHDVVAAGGPSTLLHSPR